MSLILEALRKSEAERQRAQVPGLHAPVAVPAPLRAKPGWGPWIAAGVGAVLLLGTWWVNRPASVVEPTPPVEASPPVVPAASEPAPAPEVPQPEPVPLRPTESGDPIVEPPPAPVVPAPVAPVATTPESTPPPAPEPAPSPEYVPTLATLSATERATLPPLKVSMFVWSPEPARRFAIVDGQRIGEGALLAGGTVAEIRSDGVVIELAGRRLLLPRP